MMDNPAKSNANLPIIQSLALRRQGSRIKVKLSTQKMRLVEQERQMSRERKAMQKSLRHAKSLRKDIASNIQVQTTGDQIDFRKPQFISSFK